MTSKLLSIHKWVHAGLCTQRPNMHLITSKLAKLPNCLMTSKGSVYPGEEDRYPLQSKLPSSSSSSPSSRDKFDIGGGFAYLGCIGEGGSSIHYYQTEG